MAILYKVQSGAYKRALNATLAAASVRKAIKKAKIDISVAVIQSGGWYKVQEGAFSSKANAEKRKDLLRKAGVYAVVVETKTQDEPTPAPAPAPKPAPKPEPEKPHRIRIAALAFFDTGSESSQYGDCTAIIEYGADDKTVEHAVLIDTAMAKSSANVIRKLKALGVKRLDAIVISHAHGDHYGGVSSIMRAFPTADIYVPDPTQLDRYQRSYGDALRRQYKKARGHYVSRGTAWTIGGMHFECVYLPPASALKEHDSHHFVNNESIVLRVNLNGWIYHTAGDLQNAGNNLLIGAVKDLKADIYKTQWHGDANACNEAICKAVRPLVAFSNYHHKEMAGRGRTRKRLEAVGAVVARNHENGDIYIDCLPNIMRLSCSKKNLSKEFKRKVSAA